MIYWSCTVPLSIINSLSIYWHLRYFRHCVRSSGYSLTSKPGSLLPQNCLFLLKVSCHSDKDLDSGVRLRGFIFYLCHLLNLDVTQFMFIYASNFCLKNGDLFISQAFIEIFLGIIGALGYKSQQKRQK